ncbi:DUF3916 domain-containing protein [Veronia pacifica]|uniref:DUF3916 domain-containing protein n=1 Tax=Veronia pacifica TaxID=1080227 RepID=A0A1C3EL39_9GAMM|nr:DUF3916 domain-containing protein [Veronia pacifica]ODA33958.1 hypothetical protein A8L45_07870 [Veronia pacifica]
MTRRLRSLDRWADSLVGYFPEEFKKDPYWNEKIPILDRVVDRPTTNAELQAHCAKAMLRAVANIHAAKPKEDTTSIVTALLTYPDMHQSEICVFFDPDYFYRFFNRQSDFQTLKQLPTSSLTQTLNIELPAQFEEVGFLSIEKDEWQGDVSVNEEEWWSYRPITS